MPTFKLSFWLVFLIIFLLTLCPRVIEFRDAQLLIMPPTIFVGRAVLSAIISVILAALIAWPLHAVRRWQWRRREAAKSIELSK